MPESLVGCELRVVIRIAVGSLIVEAYSTGERTHFSFLDSQYGASLVISRAESQISDLACMLGQGYQGEYIGQAFTFNYINFERFPWRSKSTTLGPRPRLRALILPVVCWLPLLRCMDLLSLHLVDTFRMPHGPGDAQKRRRFRAQLDHSIDPYIISK